MHLPSPSDPVIGVISTSPRLEMLVSRLRAEGLSAVRLSVPVDPSLSRLDAVLVDAGSTRFAEGLALMQGLEGMLAVVFGPLPAGATLPAAMLRIADLSGLAWLKARLSIERRAGLRRSELSLRAQTAAAFGRTAPAALPAPVHLLFAGAPGPAFLALHGALRRQGARLTACLSEASFRSHLAAAQVSCVLIDLSSHAACLDALALARHEDPRLHAIPVAGLLAAGTPRPEAAALDLLDTLIGPEATPDALADACLTLARRPADRSDRLQGEAHDSITGLPSRVFFESHLRRQMDASRAAGLPLSLAAFRLARATPEGQPGIAAFARRLASYLRAEDLATRIDWRTVVISLRHAEFPHAVQTASRLSRCLRHDGLSPDAFVWRVVEMRRQHDEQSLIAATLAGPFAPARAA